ncbi:MAG: hypothetical protein QG635_1248 [Bacteroidota bacterium]|nr:hypothetical protein [Bacteroidota bacterium]
MSCSKNNIFSFLRMQESTFSSGSKFSAYSIMTVFGATLKSLSRVCTAAVIFIIYTMNAAAISGSAGSKAVIETRRIVDMPTAGTAKKGDFSVYALFFGNAGLMLELSAAPAANLNLGISYSASEIISGNEPEFASLPGIHLKWRFIDETNNIPAILIGAQTQGIGSYDKSSNRYETFSPGIFLALSKAFTWFAGESAAHCGIGYTFEQPDRDYKSPNYYFGIEQTLGAFMSINVEYNANLDDSDSKYISKKGLLSASLRCSLGGGVTVELQARDLLQHRAAPGGFQRFIAIEYVGGI